MNKILPSAVDLEKTVLGAILLEKEAIHQVMDILRPEMFYHDFHHVSFMEILNLNAKGQPIDLSYFVQHLTETNRLEAAGGLHYVTTLTSSVVSSAHIIPHAQKIVQSYLKREQIRIAGELINNAYDGSSDAFEILEQAEKQLHELNLIGTTTDAVKLDTVLVEVFREIETLRHRENYLIGTTSGYKTVDRLTMGWQDTDLIIIAARPAVGKTAFTLSLGVNASFAGIPSAFFSLEMGRKQLVKRILAAQAKMYLSTIKGARLTDAQMQHLYQNGIQPLAGIPLFIDDTATMSVLQFKAKLRRLIRMYGIKIAFVDYLQLLKSGARKGANRHEQIGDISRELKIAAKELEIPIIALSQLNREADGKVPQLSNLKESGDIEQDSDMVLFLYGHSEEDIKRDAALAADIYLKVAKHRNGAQDTIQFKYDKDYQTFTDEGFGELKNDKNKTNEEDPF